MKKLSLLTASALVLLTTACTHGTPTAVPGQSPEHYSSSSEASTNASDTSSSKSSKASSSSSNMPASAKPSNAHPSVTPITTKPVNNVSGSAVTPADVSEAMKLAKSVGCTVKNIVMVPETMVTPGAAEYDHSSIYISKYMPKANMASAVLHECAHNLQDRVLQNNTAVLDKIYGTTTMDTPVLPTVDYKGDTTVKIYKVPVDGEEFNADCVAKEWGATIFYYTQDCSGKRGEAARDMIAGKVPTDK